MTERIVEVSKSDAREVGSCNGCPNHGIIFVIDLRSIGVRLCFVCYKLMRKQINALS